MKRITTGKLLLLLSASYAAYNFGLVGGFIENRPISIGGLIVGVVVNMAIAIAAGNYASIQGKKRTAQANISFVSMMILSPVIVAPVIYYRLPETFLNPLLRALYSIAWPLIGDLAIVLAGAIAGKSLITVDPPAESGKQETTTGEEPKNKSGKKRTAPDLRAQCEQIADEYACKIPDCGWKPKVDDLIAVAQKGKSPKLSANSAHGAHSRHYHYKTVEA